MQPLLVLALLAIIVHTIARPVRKTVQARLHALHATLDTGLMELILGAMDALTSAPLALVSLYVQLVSIQLTLSTHLTTVHSAQATSPPGSLANTTAPTFLSP